MPETGPLTRSMDKQFEKLFAMMAEMKAGQEGLEWKMEAGQEGLEQKMEAGQERLEQEMRSGQEEIKSQIQAHTESQVEEMKTHVDGCIGKIEEEVQSSPEFISSRPTVKPLTFDGQTPWTVFKTQFDVVSSTNGWTDFVKASQLVASLRGSAAEVLQGIPADKDRLNDGRESFGI
ncbi:hypothetical protein AVEN_171535-1 [Araneus ventricosus]|uniref:Uncharacterized protein n=1 Tax=Araneus ventricosus TaxID=182803 RepID=A0A4Y2HET3_ARAVE|nr:hypothetical protein AVEN_78313-1 [Araneus ventricosus]GBM63800.1 hypothetical protein AVEN_171535-1 [Araneus ventricosus]